MPKMLVDDVSEFIGRYVVLDDDERLVVALWVIHTYIFEAFPQTPYLAINSPERECGKTRLVEVLEQICCRAWKVISPSESVVYRKITTDKPTILIDEVDVMFSSKDSKFEPIVALLNAGNRAGTTVPRVLNPQSNELMEWKVFCPKVLAGIGTLPEATASRSIPIRLERKTREQIVERFRLRHVEGPATALRDQIQATLEEVQLDDEPDLPEALSDRQQDSAEPLLAIADALGCGDAARAALVGLFAGERADVVESDALKLLRDLRTIFGEHPDRKALFTEWIITYLEQLDDSPWKSWFGRGVNANDIADLLRPYKVTSKQVKIDGTGKKGYSRDDLWPVWERYLPPVSADDAGVTHAVAGEGHEGVQPGSTNGPTVSPEVSI